jgi:hypothetical protein
MQEKSVALRMRENAGSFLERDDISIITSGIKSTITLNGQKKQERLLQCYNDKYV